MTDVEVREIDLAATETSVESNQLPVEITANESIVEGYKKEYSIVGDGLYASVSADDAPQWLLDIIDSVVGNGLANGLSSLSEARSSILQAISEIEIAKNQYQELINIDATIDGIIASRLESLNVTLDDKFATKLEVDSTYVKPYEAGVIAAEVLTASLEGGAIKSQIDRIDSAYTTLNNAYAGSMTTIQADLVNKTTGIASNAAATSQLNAYVGVTGVSAEDSTVLTGYMTDSHGIVGGAASEVANSIYYDSGVAKSKWEYNSNLYANGQWQNSGFGLASGSTGSEFWINANKFRVSDAAGSSTPVFSIDTVDRSAVFNGKVTFNGTPTTLESAVQNYVEQVQVGDKNINITDNLIPTTSLVADINNAGYQFISDPAKVLASGIDSFIEPQITLDSDDEVYSPYLDEVQYSYYYRFGIKGVANLNSFKITTISTSNTVAYGTVTIELDTAMSASYWYIVDGIINPTGGDALTYSGSIRDINGNKIGTVRNFALPSGTSKLILGWQYNCVISRMKIAKITADTQTGSLASIDYVNNTNETVAQNLGYSGWSGMVNAAASGSTIIDGGYINTDLLQANTIAADRLMSSTNNSTVWSGGGLVSSNFNGNASGDIGTPTAGFRLSSDAAGTTTDPTIYGAYIRGGTISGVNITSDTTIEGLTLIASNLYVVTDAGKKSKIVRSGVTSVSTRSVTHGSATGTVYAQNTGIYAYNSTTSDDTYKLTHYNTGNAPILMTSLYFEWVDGDDGGDGTSAHWNTYPYVALYLNGVKLWSRAISTAELPGYSYYDGAGNYYQATYYGYITVNIPLEGLNISAANADQLQVVAYGYSSESYYTTSYSITNWSQNNSAKGILHFNDL